MSTKDSKQRPNLLQKKSDGTYEIDLPSGDTASVSPDLVDQYYAAGIAAAAFVDGLRDKLAAEAGSDEKVRIVQVTAKLTHAARTEKVNGKLILTTRMDKDAQDVSYSIEPVIVVEK